MIASVALAFGLLAGAAALGAAFTRSRIGELDRTLRQRAELVAALVATDRLPQILPADTGGAELVEVVDDRNSVLSGSATASRTLALLAPEQLASWPRNRPRSYSDDRLTGSPLRVVLLDQRTGGAIAGQPAGATVTVVAAVPLSGVRETLSALRRALLVVLPLLLLAVAAGSWLVAGSALRPVEALRRGAEQIGDVGGGGVLPVPPGADEVALLAGTLNRMLDRIASAGARQRVFLADAAHELRSPLTSLRTMLEVARAHPRVPGERSVATELLPDVLRLTRLVDDLLILARLDASPPPASSRVVDLAALATEVVADTDLPASGQPAGPAVIVTGQGTAAADPDAVRRILRNLVDNARRHASAQVQISVAPGAVTVIDDGGGIGPADTERIFERFTRLDDARTRDSGGSGLGLAIARELARRGGGDLTVNGAPGGGAAFRLTLP
ncbi:MAG: HAMP domain-containing sensor histidine kinase [Frankiaceae bacterium]